MPTYIVTGNYTLDAIRGMVANPSDRAAAVSGLIDAAGGKMISYYATTGAQDFHIVAEAEDVETVIACVIAAGASGGASNIQTMRAFTSDELMSMQKRAGELASSFKAANQG